MPKDVDLIVVVPLSVELLFRTVKPALSVRPSHSFAHCEMFITRVPCGL